MQPQIATKFLFTRPPLLFCSQIPHRCFFQGRDHYCNKSHLIKCTFDIYGYEWSAYTKWTINSIVANRQDKVAHLLNLLPLIEW